MPRLIKYKLPPDYTPRPPKIEKPQIFGISIPNIEHDITRGVDMQPIIVNRKDIIGHVQLRTPYLAISLDKEISVISDSAKTSRLLLWMALQLRDCQNIKESPKEKIP